MKGVFENMLTDTDTIYAFNAIPKEWRDTVLDSLKSGVGRFGWSYDKALDLTTDENPEFENKWKNWFLRELKPGDYVVYINMPDYGKCTLAKVSGGYFFKNPMDDDFNHCFNVEFDSIRTFDRNDKALVPNLLSSRLKLQNRYWRIYCHEEFQYLLYRLDSASAPKGENADAVSLGIDYFLKSIDGELDDIAEKLHKHHPNFDLEKLMCKVFDNTGKYAGIKRMHGQGDKGADIVLTYESEDFPGISEQKRCLVQVKSYSGEMCDNKAVYDLRRAFAEPIYKDADCGLIVSTANTLSDDFEDSLNKLRDDVGKPVVALYGRELSKYVLRYL
jgi:hypothetical protein